MKDIIVCNNFILRKLKPIDDKESIIESMNNRDVLSKLSLNFPYTEKDYQIFVNIFENEKNAVEKDSSMFIIDVNGKAVGSIGLHWKLKDYSKHIGDIGYWLNKKYWGQGIMTEAVKNISNYAFDELGKTKLTIRMLEENIGSKRVAEKSGFEFEWLAKKEVFKDGEYKNFVCYCKFNN